MKKHLLLTFFHLYIFSLAIAQSQNIDVDSTFSNIQRNSFYVELGGNGGVISINYERIVPMNNKFGLGFRIGAGTADALTGLIEVNFIFGKSKHYLETGIGYANAINYPDQWSSVRLGYRYQAKKGFLFRLAPMYIYNYERLKGNFDVFGGIWLGASFGYSF